jgi:2'-hydroxyisoflavone reductase
MINVNRRQLLLGLSAAGAGIALSPVFARPPGKKLKILVLGGTGFIGPHIVRRALARGHDVTLFNRGRSQTDLFPDVKKLVGDRDGGLEALKTGQWDVVLDNSGYLPRIVRDSAMLLKDRVGRYFFTSSIAAYDSNADQYPMGPGSKRHTWTHPDSEDVGKYYGEFKAQCERDVQEIYADRAAVVRPTFIIGPGDSSQRFTWWVDRIYRGGDIVAPGDPDTNFALIDVRDLAAFYIRLIEDGRSGEFNASGPAGRFSTGGMLNGIRAMTSIAVIFHWVDAGFLEEHEVNGRELPMWGYFKNGVTELTVENQSSIDVGLEFRPFSESVADTMAWHRQLPADKQAFTRAGLDPVKEATVLTAWYEYKRQHQHQRANA